MKKLNSQELYHLTKNYHILYVEDDYAFNEETSEILEDFFDVVDIAYDGAEALLLYSQYYQSNKQYYDLVISDINMPKMDGITLTKEIYTLNPNQPVMIVSAYNESEQLIELINIGVERFLQKPFKHEQLLEVLFHIFKRQEPPTQKIAIGELLVWDIEKEILSDTKGLIKLTKKELDLLKLFIKNSSKISTTEEIFLYVWKEDSSIATTDSLKSLISRVRKKLPMLNIETFYNIGYRLNF